MTIDGSRAEQGRLALLVQVGLAALVAGSMLALSAVAFGTGFSLPSQPGVTAVAGSTGHPRAVLLPDVGRRAGAVVTAISEGDSSVGSEPQPSPNLVAQVPSSPEPDASPSPRRERTDRRRPAGVRRRVEPGREPGRVASLGDGYDEEDDDDWDDDSDDGHGHGHGKDHSKSHGNGNARGHSKSHGNGNAYGHSKNKGHSGGQSDGHSGSSGDSGSNSNSGSSND
jgi:uncharacterized membrane protein YgcG